jgi:hypothetical protein
MEANRYVRIQARYNGCQTDKPVGIFCACYHVVFGTYKDFNATDTEKKTYENIVKWFEENLTNPPFYDDGNSKKIITWFKTSTSQDMLKRLSPLVDILSKYGVPHDVVYTDHVGNIVYEDEYQVAVTDYPFPIYADNEVYKMRRAELIGEVERKSASFRYSP